MKYRILTYGCVLALAVSLCVSLPVMAEPESGETTTTSETTTTTETATTTTESTTTTTTTTTEAPTTTTAANKTEATTTTVTTTKNTTTKATVTTSKGTSASTGTTTKGTATTTTTVSATATTTQPTADVTVPDEPTHTEPIVPAQPHVIIGEPGDEDNSRVFFCDTADGHYPKNILNNEEDYPGYTADWWVPGRTGLAVQLGGDTGRYLRLSRYLFNNQQSGSMSAFTLSMWVNWQGNGENEEYLGQKLLALSTQDLDDRWHSGDRLQWDPDIWYAFVSPHMRDNETGLDGMYIRWENQNVFDSGEDLSVADGNTTFALPTDEWHHIAVTMSESEFTLYVDGYALYTCSGMMEFEAMAPYLDRFFIGRGEDGDPMLNALIDDALLYPQALEADHIAMLAAGLDPAAGTGAPNDPEYKATRPATSGTTGTTTAAVASRVSRLDLNEGKFPVAVVAIPAAILLITVVLSLLLSPKKTEEDAPENEPESASDDAEPTEEETVEPEEDT